MRLPLLRLVLLFNLCGLSLRAEPPALLLEALRKTGEETGHWAYTETSLEKDDKGRADGETVVRFDPSKIYAEQFTPLKIKGKPPTPRQLKEYRKRGEDLAAGKDVTDIGGFEIDPEMLDLEKAKVLDDTGGVVTYEIPMSRGDGSFPAEKFQLTIRVRRERCTLERVSIRLLKPIRMMLVAKVNAGVINFDYAAPDPKYAPVLTIVSGDLSGSILFIKGGESFEQKRAEFQRVKPFDERAGVKIGPLKALPF